jgi:prophage regulatory protein
MTAQISPFRPVAPGSSAARPMRPAQVYASDAQIAERCGVTRDTIRNWHRNDPSFPRSIKISPGCTRWRIAEVDAWIESRSRSHA